MKRRLVLASVLALVSTSVVVTAEAQSLPNISGIKQTTNRAVAKTNTHTLAMTNVDSASAAAPAAGKGAGARGSSASGAKRAVESSADTSRAHGVRATAAGAATRAGASMDTAGKVVLRREVYAYENTGRRDP